MSRMDNMLAVLREGAEHGATTEWFLRLIPHIEEAHKLDSDESWDDGFQAGAEGRGA